MIDPNEQIDEIDDGHLDENDSDEDVAHDDDLSYLDDFDELD